jgi:3-methyladenine DNA glycosylase AlkD
MKQLESMGTAQNRKVYARHGAGDHVFGVSFANLEKLRRSIKQDQQLAEGLWATGNLDAMNLATMIADPHAFTTKQIDEWLVGGIEHGVIDLLIRNVVSKTAFLEAKANKWMKSKKDPVGRAGFTALAHLAMDDRDPGDGYFEERIEYIEANIHASKNRTKEAMNRALIAIGGRGGALSKKAIAAAKRIGPVDVDHGETNCKTPDAVSYIQKMLDHANKKASRKKKASPAKKVARKKTVAKKKTAKRKPARAN